MSRSEDKAAVLDGLKVCVPISNTVHWQGWVLEGDFGGICGVSDHVPTSEPSQVVGCEVGVLCTQSQAARLGG